MKKRYISVIGFSAVLLTSCTDNFDSLTDGSYSGKGINFGAKVIDAKGIRTRTPSDDYLNDVTHAAFDCNFYIQLNTELEEEPITEYGTYEVASRYEGKLEAIQGSTPLNWRSLRENHNFLGWTFPSGDMEDYGSNPFSQTGSSEFSDALENGVPITFKNSAEENGYPEYQNNKIYEKFIGNKTGDVTYIDNGTYVSMNYRHLVSKIFVDEIILNWNGSIQNHLKANMTIFGLPTQATFYPDPSLAKDIDEEFKTYSKGWPIVVPKENPEDEMTFFIENSASANDYVWICPEVDFSKLSFSVSLLNVENNFADMKEYSGTFENVVFDRTGINWDNMSNGFQNHDDSTILHAGEMMLLKIILYPGGTAGLFIQILPWSTYAPEDTPHYSHTGLYSDNTLNELVRANGNTASTEELFELYGSTQDEEKVFNLYENVTLGENNLLIADDYVLDGNKHLITVKSFPVNVKNVRNVYLTDGKGKYVYIDSDGNVFKVDAITFELGTRLTTVKKNTTTRINP